MMCEAPIQMSSNKHKYYTYFQKLNAERSLWGMGDVLRDFRLKNGFEEEVVDN